MDLGVHLSSGLCGRVAMRCIDDDDKYMANVGMLLTMSMTMTAMFYPGNCILHNNQSCWDTTPNDHQNTKEEPMEYSNISSATL